MIKKRLVIDNNTKLKIAVYHIRYSEKGESSVFILYDAEKVVYYSIVIDCYEEEQYNITDSILEQWGLAERKLDILVWTHPHDDHSLGLVNIVKKYCHHKRTKICTANVFGNTERFSSACKENIYFLNSLVHGRPAKDRVKIHPMHCYPDIIEDIEFLGYGKFDKLVLQCIAPMPNIGGIQGVDRTFDNNKIGLGCIVKLEGASGKIHMLFAGDVDNMSFESLISEADSEIPTVYNYIKIPHHGSTSGKKLIELLQMDGDVSEYASTSVYVQHHLPDKKVLTEYGNVVETLICTSDIVNQKYGKGVVYLDFDLDTKTVKTQYYGTATTLDLGKLNDHRLKPVD